MKRSKGFGQARSSGSQLYIQNLVNNNPEYLNRLIFSKNTGLAAYAQSEPDWVSPLANDSFQEYTDHGFLRSIHQADLYKKLQDFWPSQGPVWDALAAVKGKDGSNGVILAEAKAHTGELGNPGYACRAEGRSLRIIESSLSIVKEALGVPLEADWMGDYYQYANRLAHLYFLHIECQVPTWLVYICFVGGRRVSDPCSNKEWKGSLARVAQDLELPEEHILVDRIISIFPEVPV